MERPVLVCAFGVFLGLVIVSCGNAATVESSAEMCKTQF